jgi:hypothetical protein
LKNIGKSLLPIDTFALIPVGSRWLSYYWDVSESQLRLYMYPSKTATSTRYPSQKEGGKKKEEKIKVSSNQVKEIR